MLSFPVELLDAVCSELNTQELVVLARTHSRLYHVVQRALFRDVAIRVPTTLQVVNLLAGRPEIARHVRHFELRLAPTTQLLRNVYRRLATALANMPNLLSLSLFLDPRASWILADASPHRLSYFASSFSFDSHLASFLHRTPRLVELSIDPPCYEPAALNPAALPLLSQFTGSSQLAQALVPGRPVHSIHLNDGDLTEAVAETLAKSTAPIQLLIAETSSHSVSLLGTLTRCMQHLNYLRILSTYNFLDAPDTVSSLAQLPLPYLT